MAQGDVTFFDRFWYHMGAGNINLGSSFNMAILTSASTQPLRTASEPAYSGGTTNYSAIEVSAGGQYSAGGQLLTGTTWGSSTNGLTRWDTSAATWLSSAGNPSGAYWGLVYASTTTSGVKYAVCMIDLGGTFDMASGNLTVTPHANGWFRDST